MRNAELAVSGQSQRNRDLIENSRYMRPSVESQALNFSLDLRATERLTDDQAAVMTALEKSAARTALASLASLAKIGELDHLGGGLELIPALNMTMAVSGGDAMQYTIEHAHTSIGYFSTLTSWGYLDRDLVVDGFRRGLDITGHVSWVPGGTQLSGGRLGVMVPVAVGQALGLRAHHGDDALVFCHCGDAGWLSGQALNGFMGAELHGAPIVFVMNRNGIQLSGPTSHVVDRDPRAVVEAMGVEVLEIPSLQDVGALFDAYREGAKRARAGRPTMIYPVGLRSTEGSAVTLETFGGLYGVTDELSAFAEQHKTSMGTEVWIPGSLMSYRDTGPMFECLFYVNGLEGGAGHHDGHMKDRDLDTVLANPMLVDDGGEATIEKVGYTDTQVTEARPAPGTSNLVLSADQLKGLDLPGVGESVSARNGTQLAYGTIASAFPDRFFTVSCDLDPSTKLDKARAAVDANHKFEMGIMEQASSLLANGIALSSSDRQFVVFATFAAFFEGIAREGFELWRYQRNLTGSNEGVNVAMHLSHVGSCTGRDHFSGWSLDWITLAMGYLPYLDRFYTPSDARSAFVAVRDMAANYGGHIIGVPRDNLPVLGKQDGSGPLWEADSAWEAMTTFRQYEGSKKAILAVGAPAFLAGEAAEACAGTDPVDVYVVSGLPLGDGPLDGLVERYSGGLVTIEDGLIGHPGVGLRGFASLVQSVAAGRVPTAHVGIVDPTIAPSEGHLQTWAHFGITADALVEAVSSL